MAFLCLSKVDNMVPSSASCLLMSCPLDIIILKLYHRPQVDQQPACVSRFKALKLTQSSEYIRPLQEFASSVLQMGRRATSILHITLPHERVKLQESETASGARAFGPHPRYSSLPFVLFQPGNILLHMKIVSKRLRPCGAFSQADFMRSAGGSPPPHYA